MQYFLFIATAEKIKGLFYFVEAPSIKDINSGDDQLVGTVSKDVYLALRDEDNFVRDRTNN